MLEIINYEDNLQEKWDSFVLHKSINGTFLQTRKFLNYHPTKRFADASRLVWQSGNILAVIPACNIIEEGKKCFFSHKGSTFGGIVLDKDRYNISFLEALIPLLEDNLRQSQFERIVMRNSSGPFCKRGMELLDYFLFQNGYAQYDEVGFFIDLISAPEDLSQMLSSSRRRDYRYSLKYDLQFKRLETEEQISAFYQVLCSNLEKHGTRPVHSLDELLEFKYCRLQEETDFYGVFHEGKLIAGTMLFYFEKQVLHTQYLAQNAAYAKMYPMNFLNLNLIELARKKGFARFSFGISTEERGQVLNKGLALFKEGFGCDFYLNRIFYKEL